MKPIMPTTDWTAARLHDIYDALSQINDEKYQLDIYPNQIEIVPYSWMIENHSSHGGLPILYRHWSFGKSFISFSNKYKNRQAGLAYEMVINSNPCISYLMEENTETMQTLVMAHAGFGHNYVFKNNYLFKQWTDASEILDYLEFSKNYIARCEEKYGEKVVEKLLDAAHMLQMSSFTRYPRKKYSVKDSEQKRLDRLKNYQETYSEIWETLPKSKNKDAATKEKYKQRMNLPEENILYFLEKFSPNLTVWQREIIRIVRNIGQYFYPQLQCKTVHEGAATWTHHAMLHDLYDKGLINEGAMLEWFHSHAAVISQPPFNEKFGQHHFNPYALGFAINQDIERMCKNPTKEDKEWFPDIAGSGDHVNLLKNIWSEYRDESFIRQFLSPKVIRDFRMFSIKDDSLDKHWLVSNIHDREGYRQIRTILADSYLVDSYIPNVEVIDANILEDRLLTLEFKSTDGHRLYPRYTQKVIEAISSIWGYPVKLIENFKPAYSDKTKTETYDATPSKTFNENS
jgi:stage V sporulation protein R